MISRQINEKPHTATSNSILTARAIGARTTEGGADAAQGTPHTGTIQYDISKTECAGNFPYDLSHTCGVPEFVAGFLREYPPM